MQEGWSGNTIGEYSQLLFCHPNISVIEQCSLPSDYLLPPTQTKTGIIFFVQAPIAS
jgi:hypothetical protein